MKKLLFILIIGMIASSSSAILPVPYKGNEAAYHHNYRNYLRIAKQFYHPPVNGKRPLIVKK